MFVLLILVELSIITLNFFSTVSNCLGGVMVNMLSSSAANLWFEDQSFETNKTIEIKLTQSKGVVVSVS